MTTAEVGPYVNYKIPYIYIINDTAYILYTYSVTARRGFENM